MIQPIFFVFGGRFLIIRAMKKILAIYIGFILLFIGYWIIYAIAPEAHAHWLQGEDRTVEWITFAGFLSASLLAGLVLLTSHRHMNRMAFIYFLGTALFFFVCAGEEISWGQRVLGFETPESVKEINEQGEFNLHNLNLDALNIHPSELVSWYMKLSGILIPLILLPFYYRKNSAFPRYISAPALIPCYLFPELLHLIRHGTARVTSQLIRPEAAHVVDYQNEELLEMYWGLCVFLTMLFVFHAWRAQRLTPRQANNSTIRAGIASSDNTSRAAPSSAAARGIPYITELASS